MADDKPRPSLADFVTIAISPALIMAMIDSLVFFLLAVCYRGNYAGRLQYLLFFYVFGMVLVARISMETGLAERAPLYGVVLAGLMWLAMGKFVDYPPEMRAASWLINGSLIALAWWLSYQLTVSCTYIDEKGENTGAGVLEGARPPRADEKLPALEEPHLANGKRSKKAKISWFERYRRFREERKKSQPPGLWVVYFAVAALPIFGLGQALIDVGDAERRTRTFWLMTLYLASSLGLLVTTSFLGLRRYLRPRRISMPKMVTLAWLVLGGVLVAVFVGLGALLPRPEAEFSLLSVSRSEENKPGASKYAVTGGEPGEGEGRGGAQKHDPKGAPVAGKDKNVQGGGGKGKAKGQGKGDQRDQSGGKERSDQTGEQTQEQVKAKAERQAQKQAEADQAEGASESPSEAPSLSWLTPLMSALKWIVFGILALITLFFLLRGGLRYLAHFTDWARRLLEALRRFWEGLFGSQQTGTRGHGISETARAPTPLPFHSFANPFHSGEATRMAPPELVRYSFEALEAWAGEHESARRIDESPIEFTTRLLRDVPGLDRHIQPVGFLYAQILYSSGRLAPDWSEKLKRFWNGLETAPVEEVAHR